MRVVREMRFADAALLNRNSLADAEVGSSGAAGDDDSGEGAERPLNTLLATKYPPPPAVAMLSDSVEGWDVAANLQRPDRPTEMPDITMCAMGFEGRIIFGIGQNGTLFIWQPKEALART